MAVLALPSADVSGGAHAPAAVIAASAVNQDGRSSGLTAPNGPAQTRLVAGATAASGYGPADTKLVRRGRMRCCRVSLLVLVLSA